MSSRSEYPAAWSAHPGWPAKLGPIAVPAGRITLRPIRLRDGAAWSRTRIRDHEHLRPWEPTGEGSWEARHHVSAWPSLCWGLRRAARRGLMIPLTIELNGKMCGQLTVGNILRGPLQSAWIGYWVDRSVTGAGIATAALALGVDHCFHEVGLHRIEATVRPDNLPSRAVLRKVGFREEGLLQRYLDVDGGWRDHLLVAMTREEMLDGAVARLVNHGKASWV